MTLEGIAECVPLLSLDEFVEFEFSAEFMVWMGIEG